MVVKPSPIEEIASEVARTIARYVENIEQVHEIVDLLSTSTDWNKILFDIHQAEHKKQLGRLKDNARYFLESDARKEQRYHAGSVCKCGNTIPYGFWKYWCLRFKSNAKYSYSDTFMCPDCAMSFVRGRRYRCEICGNIIKKQNPLQSIYICPDCRTDVSVAEYKRVAAHVGTSKRLELVSTLNFRQWINTLDFFNWSCAYCGGDYECLEHFVPVSKGGATSANNCVPSCTSCNMRKSNWNPLEGGSCSIPTERIEAVRWYLATR